jgi:hypothetical protein
MNVDSNFEGRAPSVRKTYEKILEASRKFGPLEEDPKKTSIHLNRRTAFAGIATRKECLILTIKYDSALSDERVSKSEQASANRWHHEIKLTDPANVDAQIIAWLKHAYEISG